MAKIWVLQHHPIENLGTIADALEGAALAWQYVRTFDGHPVPRDMKGAGGLIVMGGPMGVYESERYPFLADEMRLIESAIRENKPVLGVCLGSQLVAATLGAKVAPGPRKEIGWYPVRLAPDAASDRLLTGIPKEFVALHWHGDVFDLPRGAVTLASSDMTPLQAFRHGDNVYGFLFHIESTVQQVHAMAREFADEVKQAGADGAAIVEQAADNIDALAQIADTIFSRWSRPILGT